MQRPKFSVGNQDLVRALTRVLDYVDYKAIIPTNGFQQTAGGVLPTPGGDDGTSFSHPFQCSIVNDSGYFATIRSGIVYGVFAAGADQVPEISGTPIDDDPAPTISMGASPANGTHQFWLEWDVSCSALDISATPVITYYTPGSTWPGDTNVDLTSDPCVSGEFGRLIAAATFSGGALTSITQHMFTNPQVVICIDGTVYTAPSP